MFNIQEYLKKFSQKIDSEEYVKEIIIEKIKENTNISLNKEQIEVKNYVVCIKANQAILNKIFIYKSKIIDDFLKILPNEKIIDIK